jgi:hypothetical protein
MNRREARLDITVDARCPLPSSQVRSTALLKAGLSAMQVTAPQIEWKSAPVRRFSGSIRFPEQIRARRHRPRHKLRIGDCLTRRIDERGQREVEVRFLSFTL